MPERIQLSRAKGWRMPENTVKVDRSTKWGNPFTVADAVEVARVRSDQAPAHVVACFRLWLDGSRVDWLGTESEATCKAILDTLPKLRGKNLACWCKPGAPCHADVLLELANR